ncbi:MAG: LysE/ArgO family amino acid transporter [Pseudomonadota bacterium]|jgi:L-lysine exporter family protein LysE/ArgO
MWESYLTGLFVCGGIIMAIGAQNAYVLGLAIRREHHWWSAGVCISADIMLLTAGMFGVSAVLLTMPSAMEALRWVGVVFLSYLAAMAFIRTATGRQGLNAEAEKTRSLAQVLLATLAVTVLNPQVYLDTLLLIPAIGAQQSSASTFVAGAATASVGWFSLLAWGGARLSPWLSRPKVWRSIDGLIGAMMAAVAIQLALGSALLN